MITLPIHVVLLVINWRCSSKLYIIQGPILTLCSALPTLYLMYKDEDKHANPVDSAVEVMRMSFAQWSFAIITAMLTSGAYLMTSITLISATALIALIRNHNLDRLDK